MVNQPNTDKMSGKRNGFIMCTNCSDTEKQLLLVYPSPLSHLKFFMYICVCILCAGFSTTHSTWSSCSTPTVPHHPPKVGRNCSVASAWAFRFTPAACLTQWTYRIVIGLCVTGAGTVGFPETTTQRPAFIVRIVEIVPSFENKTGHGGGECQTNVRPHRILSAMLQRCAAQCRFCDLRGSSTDIQQPRGR